MVRRKRQRNAGLCLYGGCAASAEVGRRFCRNHAELNNARARTAYASGPQRVRTCGEESCPTVIPPRVHLCAEHRAARHLAAVVRANKKTYAQHSEERRLNMRQRRQKRVANGLCADAEHCKNPVLPNLTRCQVHRDKAVENSRKYYAARRTHGGE